VLLQAANAIGGRIAELLGDGVHATDVVPLRAAQ
jgi:hypothetical protein